MNYAKTLILVAAIAAATATQAAPLVENFDNVSTLTANGWVITNNSTPVGSTDWFQGNSGVFTSQAGAADSYVAANFNASNGGVIDNWLISPELTLGGASTLSFYTRTDDASFLDMLEVRFSTGASSNVADFTTTLLTIGDTSGYPEVWTLFSVVLPSAATGRFAFHYTIADSLNLGDYIGIDTLRVDINVPEPGTFGLLALAMAGLLLSARARRSAED